MARVPIFRRVTHPELEKIGVAGGVADHAFLALAAANTNRLIREKKHIPPIRQTHRGRSDGLALGYAQSAETDGVVLFGEIDLNDLGRDLVSKKQLRTLSVAFKRNFPLNGGTDGGTLPGPYIDHVALLGDELPAIKGLVDLAEVKFSEGEPSGWITTDETTGEVTYFAEFNPHEESDDMNEVQELKDKLTKLEADFSEQKKRADEAEAKLAAKEQAEKEAAFAAHKSKVATSIKAAVDAKKLTAEKAIELTALGERAYGNEVAEAIFAETLANLAPANVPGDGDRIPPDPKATAITKADIEAANRNDLAASAKVSAAFAEAKQKDANLTMLGYIAQFTE